MCLRPGGSLCCVLVVYLLENGGGKIHARQDKDKTVQCFPHLPGSTMSNSISSDNAMSNALTLLSGATSLSAEGTLAPVPLPLRVQTLLL